MMSTTADLVPPKDGWLPANDVEEQMQAAARAGDVAHVMGIAASAPLYLPGVQGDGQAGQRMLTVSRDGVPYLLVFTSVPTMQRAIGHDGWRATTLAELVRAWRALTGDQWGLAINPGTPVGVLVAPAEVSTLLPVVDGFAPANETERLLRDALAAPDGAALADVLATSRVWLPVRALHLYDEWVVPVFTDPARCSQFLDALGVTVQVRDLYVIEVLGMWPGDDHRLAVNPGTSIGFSLPGHLVGMLLAHAAGLARLGKQTEPTG